MRYLPLLACALAAGLPACGRAALNLVADGGFETNPAAHGGYSHHAGGSSFDGGHWFVTGFDVLHIDTALSSGDAPPILFNAHGGRSSLDLTGTGNSSPLDGVYQDVATVAGQAYSLAFFVGRAVTSGTVRGDYRSNATVRVTIDGGPVQEFVNADTVTSGIAWKGFTLGFTAAGATTRIAFVNGVGNDYLGLDDVSLTAVAAVPEPSGWALSFIGFVALATTLRRHRRAFA